MDKAIYGLIGRTLGHSYSVPIHNALGNSEYKLYELEPEQLNSFLHRPDFRAANVTIPYKKDIMAYLDEISPEAAEIGSVNTVVNSNGKLIGYNTDAYGFEKMAEAAGINFTDKKAVIFGSGGASLSAQYVAKKCGARETVVISRSGEDNYSHLDKHADAEIIINATPVGMYPNTGNTPCSVSKFEKCVGVLDMIYNPRRTALLMEAEALKIPCADGLTMLVAQAKAAEELFFGNKINDSVISEITSMLRRKTDNIILIGMPGCGKNTVGEALAEISGREIIDIDAEIIKTAGRAIPEIFSELGESSFRDFEHNEITKAGRENGKIIICGGGIVKTPDNYASLHQNGRIYHIERDVSLLSREGRPLSANADLGKMYEERLPLYKNFRDVVITNDSTPQDCAEKIWSDFCENTCY